MHHVVESASYSLLACTNCSAGIGRTGTVILVLYLLKELETTKHLSPSSALVALRESRPRLVENAVSLLLIQSLTDTCT